eukprot:3057815-Prymnesium_polylepis.1
MGRARAPWRGVEQWDGRPAVGFRDPARPAASARDDCERRRRLAAIIAHDARRSLESSWSDRPRLVGRRVVENEAVAVHGQRRSEWNRLRPLKAQQCARAVGVASRRDRVCEVSCDVHHDDAPVYGDERRFDPLPLPHIGVHSALKKRGVVVVHAQNACASTKPRSLKLSGG